MRDLRLIPILFAVVATPAAAQTADTGTGQAGSASRDIIVTAPRLEGAVQTDVPPIMELDEKAIESYGATSVAELLSSLSPQTGPGRGRGGGGPVVLLNGQRISGFSEIRDLPPEAIQRVQVLPEEVALQYGFAADQRVMNFILKDRFKAATVSAELGASTAGARTEGEYQASGFNITKQSRVTLTGEYDKNTRVLESDRSIRQDGTVPDAGDYRTLLPASDTIRVNGIVNRKIVDGVSATFNGSWQRDTSDALLGRPSALLTIPAGRPFSPANAPLSQTFFFDPALARHGRTDALHGGVTLNGGVAGWNWTLTGNYDRSIAVTGTDRSVNAAALQADVSSGTGDFNPYGPTAGALSAFTPRDIARSQTDATNAIYTFSGSPLTLPAGKVRATFRGGFVTTRLNGSSVRSNLSQATRLSRDEANGRVNIVVPLADAAKSVAAPLGKLSINANLAYRKLSDFGGLTSFGYGLNWQPVTGLTILASVIGAEIEPDISSLGNPAIVTPAVPTYDFSRGETVLVSRISGGNPGLVAERQRDIKLSANYQPSKLQGLTIGVDYLRNRSTNPVAAFPTLTPDIEAAFAGRAVRDVSGRLISIDSRSVNFAATESDVVRVGFTFQKSFGERSGGRRFGGPEGTGGGPIARPDNAENDNNGGTQSNRTGGGSNSAGASTGSGGGAPGAGGAAAGSNARGGGGGFGGGGFGGGGFGGRGGPQGGRWTIALYDNIRLRDRIQIRPGLPALDLLGGDATGSSGGSPRHSFDLDAGWFNKGVGLRLTGSYLSGSTVIGSTDASTLAFGSLATLNANVFITFDNQKKLVEEVPFLKGSRLRLALLNITNAIRDVRDGRGQVPLGYQPGYLDARGRVIRLDFRKRF